MNNVNDTFGPLAGAGTVQKGATGSNLTVTVPTGGSSTFSGTITGGGNFAKAGPGTQTLSGANDYTGLTTVSAGTLATLGGGTLGTGNVTVADAAGAILSLGNNVSIADSATLTFGTNSAIVLAGAGGTSEVLTSLVKSTATSQTLSTPGTYTAMELNSFFGVSSFSSPNGETLTIVPEPAAFALLGLGSLSLLARRRRMA
jgi:autotransporter-associated beta strand protein